MTRDSTEALVAGQKAAQKQVNKVCRFCNGNHWSDDCRRNETAEERKQRIRGSCYICMKEGHKIGECGSKQPVLTADK